ncbi:M48 family metallopeptidase [Dyadobacter pollutisoli]|uniref:M48 family metallopeptidase n=1 Tax=Dyadobacter pollutisoli TaxID=2910158 RepID=A0A9E8NB37_9BACT|nr:M48 family metallopeptidase [Dyadobacter pollutisoli]WAC11797.1 M48 family metallopeptidase [Dyadobacter pollutisoli]
MQHFSISYYDGTVSLSNDATLTLMPDHWLIHYVDESGELQAVKWKLENITTDQNLTTLFIFRYGDFPQQTIECKEEALPRALKEKYPSKIFFERKLTHIFKQNNTILIGLVLFLLALLGAAYLYILPFVAEKIASNIPESVEKRLGDAIYDGMIAGYTVDDSLTRSVNDFAKSINFKTAYPITVTVVKENEVNAFALPGGHVVVFDQILLKMKSKEELAALLGHEVAHVHYQHSLKSMFRGLAGYLFVSLLLNDINGIAAVMADNSNMLVNLTYSRELETEADRKAMKVIQSNGISLKGFVDLFQLLKNSAGNAGQYEILSSHPLTEERITYAKAMSREQTGIRDQSQLQRKWIDIGINSGK